MSDRPRWEDRCWPNPDYDDEIRKAAYRWGDDHDSGDPGGCSENGFEAGARWMQDRILERIDILPVAGTGDDRAVWRYHVREAVLRGDGPAG